MNEKPSNKSYQRLRVRLGLGFTLIGLAVFILGVRPDLFGLDRSPVMGFVQIAVFLIGLAFVCLGGFIAINVFWNGHEKSILADIGFRLVATGYVICLMTGLADVFGFGNQPMPLIPYFGPWQALGVVAGMVVIGVGFLLFIPWKQPPS